jgi:hypothetical protein
MARDQVVRPSSSASDRLEHGRSIRLGLELSSSTNLISTPRLFICIRTNLARVRWLMLAPLQSSVGRGGTSIETRIPSRLSSTRSTSSASADAAPLSARSLSIHSSVDFRTDGSRFASIRDSSHACAIAWRSASIAWAAVETERSITGADSRHRCSAFSSGSRTLFRRLASVNAAAPDRAISHWLPPWPGA